MKLSKVIKYAFYSILPLIILLVAMEIALRVYHYQITARSPVALYGAVKVARTKVAEFKRREEAKRIEVFNARLRNAEKPVYESLFGDEGKELLDEFIERYDRNLGILITEVNNIQSKFVMLYPPSLEKDPVTRGMCRNIYSGLARKYGVPFLDMTDELESYPVEAVTLLPENSHLSRFGNKLIVLKLAEHIRALSAYRSPVTFKSRPDILGDLEPGINTIWLFPPKMPYRVISNNQGLRMGYDLFFPRSRQRVLILGDSATFGPFLENHDTYPGLLAKALPDCDIINAGIAGYTITDEASLFVERAKYVEPDITVLQVLDNDIYDLFFFKRNEFDRKRLVYEPSEKEVRFLDTIGVDWNEIMK